MSKLQEFRRRNIDVLVLDDDPELGDEIKIFLERRHFRCFVTMNPSAALRRIKGHQRPFILLSDIHMPEMSGIELAEWLRANISGSRCFATVLFSGFADVEKAVSALRLGVLDFLVKPFELDQLMSIIERAMVDIERQYEEYRRREVASLTETITLARDMATRLEKAVQGVENRQVAVPPAQKAQDCPETPTGHDWLLRSIKWHQRQFRVRDRCFPICAYENSSWEIILYVLEQHLLGRKVPVTSACHATTVPQTTALRKIEDLIAAELLRKQPDRLDRRRALLAPTEACLDKAGTYFKDAFHDMANMLRSEVKDRSSNSVPPHCAAIDG